MKQILRSSSLFLGLFFTSVLLSACGGNTDSSQAGNNVGKTAILLTDHRETRIQNHNGETVTRAKEIWVSIRSISLKPEEGDWVTAFNGPPNQTVDLLTLDGTAVLLAMADLPPGR